MSAPEFPRRRLLFEEDELEPRSSQGRRPGRTVAELVRDRRQMNAHFHAIAEEREATARHEAGHAAIALELGCELQSANIIPSAGTLGIVHYRRPVFESVEAGVRADVLIDIAGPCAERPGALSTLFERAPTEVAEARALVARVLGGEPDQTLKDWEWELRELLATPRVADRVDAIAAALLARNELDADGLAAAVELADTLGRFAVAEISRRGAAA